MLVTAEKISKSYGLKPLLSEVDFYLNDTDKVGIIGINGTGKSTLLRILSSQDSPDSGEININKTTRISYLRQDTMDLGQETVMEYVLGKKRKDGDAIKEYEAKEILLKLGIGQWDTPMGQLSGGQKKRAAIARTLAGESELLVLDEPTNHLDSDAILWLEQYLIRFSGGILMITHDRYFLDRVTNKIVELEGGRLHSYNGNYTDYLEMKALREESLLASERKRQSILKKELAWMRQGIKARGTRNRGRVERLENLKDQQGDGEREKADFSSVSSRLGKKIVSMEQLSKTFGDKILFQDFTYTVLKRDRIGILGDNGCGKTTLLKILTGELMPDEGILEIGETVKIGYFSQENQHLRSEQKVIDFIRDIAEIVETGEGTATASQMLERFLFPPELQYNEIGRLSGGEKRRLSLLAILMGAPNVLLLDEPTNDLDIETLGILEDYLEGFAGAVLAVSHDRYFLDRVVDKVFAFEEGNIHRYNGGYSNYLEILKEKKKDEIVKEKTLIKAKAEGKGPKEFSLDEQRGTSKKRISYNERREFEVIDEEIEELELVIKEKEKEVTLSSTNHALLQDLLSQKEELDKKLELKMERWVYLTELFEEVEGKLL